MAMTLFASKLGFNSSNHYDIISIKSVVSEIQNLDQVIVKYQANYLTFVEKLRSLQVHTFFKSQSNLAKLELKI